MSISCIAIDDEPIALKQITSYINKTPFLSHVASCKSAFEAMDIITKQKVDLLFVDIHMPDLNGVDFVKLCGKGPKIVFTTAYEQYAVDGFKVDAVDYLLKPFGYDEFLKSAQKVKFIFDLERRDPPNDTPELEYFFVRSDYKLVKIFYKDILYVEGQREYIKIFTKKGSPVVTLASMKSIGEKFPSTQFMRVHKSFIVNLSLIDSVDNGKIIIADTIIPVGEQYKKEFTEFLNKKCK
jgi:DNA-binding LytR/AlgR family response regulator